MSCYISEAEACYQFIMAVEYVIPVVHHVRGALSTHTCTALHHILVRPLPTGFIISNPFPSSCRIAPPFECVIPMVHRVQCTLSIHKCTALNCIPVRHLHTTYMVIRVTVSSHRFHYRSPISICLPHCATI